MLYFCYSCYGLAGTRTHDLASTLEVGPGGARSSGETASNNYNLRSVLTIAFQFTFENHFREMWHLWLASTYGVLWHLFRGLPWLLPHLVWAPRLGQNHHLVLLRLLHWPDRFPGATVHTLE
ncbi:hypothetical protein NE237_020365 [Protea cynaroides]|uniref:Uncharacterized protein n=1 Tax=Protea cynaroides TaxID=273540 RepID=A0A9Q0K3D0_9MAGN|nr:hypothetical protein NE237_020365 [Protea cynaroides]